MSRHKRESASKKIDTAIALIVEDESVEEDQDSYREALQGLKEVVFGIWTSLDQISAAINEAAKNG